MKSPTEQLVDKNGKIVWLASFPKSGNTWFRCLISALFNGYVDINEISTDGIFSNRKLFENCFDVDSRMFVEEEVKLKIARLYEFNAKSAKQLMWIKVHDAYVKDLKKKPIFPKSITHKAVYLVRNPLDIVASYANHNVKSIDHTIDYMCDKQAYMCKQANGLHLNHQFQQLVFDWAGHVNSWLDQTELDVIVVRYEDMKKNGPKLFYDVIKRLEFKVSKKQIQEAVDLAAFEKLKKAESAGGFKEKNAKSISFFRKGQTGGWVNELTKEQAQRIIDQFGDTMIKLGYKIPNLNKVYN